MAVVAEYDDASSFVSQRIILQPCFLRLGAMITCTELYTAEKVILQKLPAVCDMRRRHGLRMFRLMVGVPNSRWLKWVVTSGVEELKLPTSMMDEEMLIMFSGERFSKLRTLNLFLKGGGRNITL